MNQQSRNLSWNQQDPFFRDLYQPKETGRKWLYTTVGKHTSQNEGISNDLIENKGQRFARLGISYDVTEKKGLI